MTLDAWLKPLAPLVRGLIGRSGTYALYETWQRALGYPDMLEMFESQLGRRPNLQDPRTFGEKITWLKLHDKNPLLPVIADKVTAREWIAQRVGSDKLVPLVGIYNSAAAIDAAGLPQQFIAKLNNGSGRNLIIRDKAAVDWEMFRRTFDGWVREPQVYRLMEWYHHQHDPRIVVEHLLVGSDGSQPHDYKLFAFCGEVKFIYCIQDRFTNRSVTVYTPDWQIVPARMEARPSNPTPVPSLLDLMIETAEKLAHGFPFMRVDTYCHEGRLYAGELTPHPYSGMLIAAPLSFDLELGGYLDLASFRGRYWESTSSTTMSR